MLKIVLVIGMLLSALLIYEHFSESASKFCTFGNSLNCGVVNKSPYANLDGISYLLTIDLGLPLPIISISDANPVLDLLTSNAFLGLLTLLFLFALVRAREKRERFLFVPYHSNLKWLRGVLIFSVAYGAYLFAVQHFLLKTYCIFCLGLDIVLVVSLVLAFMLKENGS
ncbi:hypothetical protein D6817_00175 [Candidatus Pacearchaeota archaeon]|nr:MAG: hypothetical protein D6817_00175 [Candidatus Pacearchaeota archaeon]